VELGIRNCVKSEEQLVERGSGEGQWLFPFIIPNS
jgi:hypothetical protein